MELRISDVIEKAKFGGVHITDLSVPASVRIDRERVESIKSSLSLPDKTQMWLGVIQKVDNEGNTQHPLDVYVNAELFLALQETSESEVEEGLLSSLEDVKIAAVIHTIQTDDEDKEMIGQFLHQNSLSFGEKLRENLMIQDLLRFVVSANLHTDPDRKFVKKAMKNAKKGSNRNIKILMDFAKLPSDYLSKFEKFVALFEFSKLNGQGNFSVKKVRNGTSKLELPIDFLKKHLNADANMRKDLLDKILSGQIAYPLYRSEILR